MGSQKQWRLIAGLLLSVCSALMAQQARKPLTNDDVVKMVKGSVPESVIISAVRTGPSNFDLSPDALIRLHRLGVPKGVMDAMMAARSQMPAATAPPPRSALPQASPASAYAASPPVTASMPMSPPPPGMPSAAVLLEGGVSQQIPLEKTQLEETRTKPSSLMSLASDSALASALQGGTAIATGELAGHVHSGLGATSLGEAGGLMSGMMFHHKVIETYVWAVHNVSSANMVPTRSPIFSVAFSDVPGVRSSDYEPAIVKLTPAQNAWRLVGATQGKEQATSSSSPSWQIYENFLEDRVALNPQKMAPGRYRISPAAPLLPGEYAVVLRPVSKSKKFSGADVARAQGDGLMFNAVWSFQVHPDAKP